MGPLDPAFSVRQAAIYDWAHRAQTLGFFFRRANHAAIVDAGRPLDGWEAAETSRADRELLESRWPHHEQEDASFRCTLDGSLAAHATGLRATGKLRVAYDIRHLPPEHVGTRTFAICLARALAELSDIELTLLVAHPVQADGLDGRVVTEEQWQDDVAIIHKPAQVFDRRHIGLLFGSSAHCVITYLDLIAYRVPLGFRDHEELSAYRTTSGLALQAAQGIHALSHNAAREIASEFGIPRDEVSVAHLGVHAERFARREPVDEAVLRELGLPARYFFSVATDYPHKNLSSLLTAYASLRADGEVRASRPAWCSRAT